MPRFSPIPDELVHRLNAVDRVMLLTGSGISAASGVPTFRDAQTGLWAKFRPEELATPEAFAVDPDRVWRWYRWRRNLVAKAKPNAAHFACAAMQNLFRHCDLVTQNVDGLHSAAGSKDVVEFHGNIFRERCQNGHASAKQDLDNGIPRCSLCGSPVRPDVVWFGEPIPASAIASAEHAAIQCDAYLAVGTSALVYPANSYANIARHHGALLIEVNTEQTPMSGDVDYFLRGRAEKILPELVNRLQPVNH